MPRLALAALLLACLAAPAHAQSVEIPGRRVIEDNGFLLEVVYVSSEVRLRLYDLVGRPVDMSGLWLERCTVDVIARRGERRTSRSAKVRLIQPQDGLPYLRAEHQLGPLHAQDALTVAVKLKNVASRGDVNDRWKVVWQRDADGLRCLTAGPHCRQTPERACALCRHHLCLRTPERFWR